MLELRQGQLKNKIREMGLVELRRLLGFMEGVCGIRVRAKASERAKLYAVIRFSQENGEIGRPQAWVDSLARREESNLQPGQEDRARSAPAREGRIKTATRG
jgi:hypothetical protein